MIGIARDRYVIVRNGTEIFCGQPGQYNFRPIKHVGAAPIKTYRSPPQALAALSRSWGEPKDRENCKIVRVMECITEVIG